MLPALFLLAALDPDAATDVAVREACSEDASIVTKLRNTDEIVVHHGVAGESTPCYAVSVLRSSTELRGYILGASLPAVQEFERRRAVEARVPIPAPPPSPVPTVEIQNPGPLANSQFEPWNGSDWKGKLIEIRPGLAKVTLVSFWRPTHTGRAHIVDIDFLTRKFSSQGLRSIGFIVGASVASTKEYLEDVTLGFPQVLDRSSLASRYGVDAGKGTTLILDISNKVVASSSDAKKIQEVVASLLAR